MIITPLASPTRALIKAYHWLLAHSLPRPATHGYTVHSGRAVAPPSWSTSAPSAPGTRGPSLNQCWEDARRKRPGSCCPWSPIWATVCVAPNSVFPSLPFSCGASRERTPASLCFLPPSQGNPAAGHLGRALERQRENSAKAVSSSCPYPLRRCSSGIRGAGLGRPRWAEACRGEEPEAVGHS